MWAMQSVHKARDELIGEVAYIGEANEQHGAVVVARAHAFNEEIHNYWHRPVIHSGGLFSGYAAEAHKPKKMMEWAMEHGCTAPKWRKPTSKECEEAWRRRAMLAGKHEREMRRAGREAFNQRWTWLGNWMRDNWIPGATGAVAKAGMTGSALLKCDGSKGGSEGGAGTDPRVAWREERTVPGASARCYN